MSRRLLGTLRRYLVAVAPAIEYLIALLDEFFEGTGRLHLLLAEYGPAKTVATDGTTLDLVKECD